MASRDPQEILRAELLDIAMHHVVVAEQVGQRVAAARRGKTEPTVADHDFLEHWLQVLEVLAGATCDQPHPDLKALAARLHELTGLVRVQVMN